MTQIELMQVALDLSKDFKMRFGVSNADIEKWKIVVREQKPYKRSHSKGGSKKYR